MSDYNTLGNLIKNAVENLFVYPRVFLVYRVDVIAVLN